MSQGEIALTRCLRTNGEEPKSTQKDTSYRVSPLGTRCWRNAILDGQIECSTMPLEDSLLMMQVLNKVRKDGSFRYPNSLEGVDLNMRPPS